MVRVLFRLSRPKVAQWEGCTSAFHTPCTDLKEMNYAPLIQLPFNIKALLAGNPPLKWRVLFRFAPPFSHVWPHCPPASVFSLCLGDIEISASFLATAQRTRAAWLQIMAKPRFSQCSGPGKFGGICQLPSGTRLHKLWKDPPFLMEKSTINGHFQ